MNEVTRPKWFNTVVYVAIAWNLIGLIQYIAHVSITPEALAAMSAAERDLIMSMPSWATGAFALAVTTGFLGAAMLLMKKALALYFFMGSTLAVLVQNYYSFFMSRSVEVYGPAVYALPSMVVVISLLLVWFSLKAKNEQWIS